MGCTGRSLSIRLTVEQTSSRIDTYTHKKENKVKHQTKVATGSKTDEYATPEFILNFARMCFGVGQFDLDPFTMEHNPTNALMYFTKEDDGLVQDWYKARNIWINPPFSRMADVVPKVIHEAERGVNNPSIIM